MLSACNVPSLTSGTASVTSSNVTTIAGLKDTFGDAVGYRSVARFNNPRGICVSPITGDTFIVDMNNGAIKRMTPDGTVLAFVSTGLSYPSDIVCHPSGEFYVTDLDDCVIYNIDANGNVSHFSGDGGDNSVDGDANTASFNVPIGLALDDNGFFYVTEGGGGAIRKVAPNGSVTTLAGSDADEDYVNGTGSAARFNSPTDLAVDSAGNVYVADSGNSRIRMITSGGVVTTFAGSGFGDADGTTTAAQFVQPTFLAFDSDENLYVGDAGTMRLIKNGMVTTILGQPSALGYVDGPARTSKLGNPGGMAISPSGVLYFSQYLNQTIRKFQLPN